MSYAKVLMMQHVTSVISKPSLDTGLPPALPSGGQNTLGVRVEAAVPWGVSQILCSLLGLLKRTSGFEGKDHLTEGIGTPHGCHEATETSDTHDLIWLRWAGDCGKINPKSWPMTGEETPMPMKLMRPS